MALEQIDIQLRELPLSPNEAREFVAHPGAGAQVEFIGTVRHSTGGRAVQHLVFESYAPMAIQEMRKIADQALAQFDLLRVAIHHRTGRLAVGEIPVVIAISAAHRAAAFSACQYCIDTLKKNVPIWKKEVYEDGEVWVSAHP